ncbi:MAG: cell division FtsA domain-containing protein, partial [Candidatus Spechtbacterales bacterium]
YEPYAVFSALKERKEKDLSAIIIDVGSKTTRVSLARKGRFEDIKTFSFGGESFTRRIASHFEVGFWEAENIKKRFSRNELGDEAQSTVTEIMQPEISIFLNALEMILKDFSRANLLPSNIYIHGGGGDIPLMDGIIRKKKWKRDLSFLDKPVLHRLKADMFENIEIENSKIESSRIISLLSVSDNILHTVSHRDDLLSKTMQRVVKLIHE